MLHSVSWLTFGGIVGGGLLLYYAWLAGRILWPIKAAPPPAPVDISLRVQAVDPRKEDENLESSLDPDEPLLANELELQTEYFETVLGEIFSFLANQAPQQLSSERIQSFLSTLFRQYPELQKSAYRIGIARLLQAEYQKRGLVPLSDEEFEQLWY